MLRLKQVGGSYVGVEKVVTISRMIEPTGVKSNGSFALGAATIYFKDDCNIMTKQARKAGLLNLRQS